MARKFLTPIDLAKNELQNAAVQNLASDPSSPVAGQIYFNTVDKKLKQYDGTSWIEYSTATSSGDFSSNTSTSVDSEVVIFSGTTGKIGKRATGSGIAKLTSGVLSTATAGTDYVAATSGSTIQKADGAGGLTAATSATDYAPATTGSSALKASSGGFATATINDLGSQTADYSANSHKITNVTDPSSAQDAATKAYVDATAQGLNVKNSVRAATTGAETFTILTGNVTVITGTTIDGTSPGVGDRILVKDAPASTGGGSANSTQPGNGIYTVTNATTNLTISRASDMSGATNLPAGAFSFVEGGTANASAGFVVSTPATNSGFTYGTNNIAWTQFSGAGEITAGTGLAKSGNTISIENSGVLTVAHGGTGAATLTGLVKGNGTSAFTAAASGTDYAPATATTSILKGNGSGGFTAAKFTATIGDGSTTAIAVTDSLGTIDKVATVRDASTGVEVECDVTYSSTQVTFTFAVAPASNAYKVVIIG